MTGKERFLKTLRFETPDRPPHFESMFELEQEAFGLKFPDRASWKDCSSRKKKHQIADCVEIYQQIVARYRWDALAVYWPWSDPEGVAAAKEAFGDAIAIGGMVGGGVWAIEHVSDWLQFAADLRERPGLIHGEAEKMCRCAEEKIDQVADAGADFVFMPHDVAFNAGPFISPPDFAEFVAPYWARLVARVKDHKLFGFIHTDGQIMPILDQLLNLGAHCLQSLDPMAGVDIAEVKKRTHGRLALMGNVQCNLLQEGPKEAIRASALYCLEHASSGGGYIFSTSNTIFAGMPLENYEYMLSVFREFCETQECGG